MGLTTSGKIDAQSSLSLDEAVDLVTRLRDAIFAVNPEAIIFSHGASIASPEDARHVLAKVHRIAGFLGTGSQERLPTEVAMVNHMRSFHSVS